MNLKISIFMVCCLVSVNVFLLQRLVVCHAELNAVLNRNEAHSGGCTLFTTMFPCNECAKVIIQAGIKEVVYYSDKKNGTESNQAAKYLFNKAGVSIRYDFMFLILCVFPQKIHSNESNYQY